MSVANYAKIATLRSVQAFRSVLQELGAEIPCDEKVLPSPESPLAQSCNLFGKVAGNRFAIQPMEGWDGTADGRPGENTIRRWRRFGESGAKLIWGGEAVAVCPHGRANPNQLMINSETYDDLGRLLEALIESHATHSGHTDDLVIGLQLTHSGRYARPNRKDKAEPQILYRHPILDTKVGVDSDGPILSDSEIRRIIEQFHRAAGVARSLGFDFVDVKHCHGYLGHEFLSAYTRPGDYGGSLENRTRFLREIIEGIRSEAPGLGIGVRLSAFDIVPFRPDPEQSRPGKPGPGIFEDYCDFMPYRYGFGVDSNQPVEPDMTETVELFNVFRELGITVINVSAGSPYYNPHIQRPALYPPSDGYQPPEDPLVGVARQMYATRFLKQAFPDFTIVGSAYSYLQEFLPNVAQAAMRDGWTDFVGLGRMVLTYPEFPRDILSGVPIQTKRLCRTFSDCTTAPRNGLVSGCYPLDPHYKFSTDATILANAKKAAKG